MNPLRIVSQTCQLWWQEWVGILCLNLLWLLLQLPLVTGPPATAVLYAICQKMIHHIPWDVGDVGQLLRCMFWPAWKWALPSMLILLVLAANFYAYQAFQGRGWIALRLFWGLLLALWFTLNLFFWPFWLVQEDQSLKTTYKNVVRLLVLHPWTVIMLTAIAGFLLAISFSMVFLLAIGSMGWLALAGSITVHRSLALPEGSAQGGAGCHLDGSQSS